MAARGRDPGVPAIVFVSRAPIPGEPSAVPGLGPHDRAVVTGGRLLVRERDGRVRELLPAGTMLDASDPAVSPDARHIAFAGVVARDSAWRLYACDVSGEHLRAITSPSRDAAGAVAADLDPCWLSDSMLVFASTRGAWRSQYADVPATHLWRVRADGRDPTPLTADRNGAEEPTYDVARDRIVYTRWWFNRYRPSRTVSTGVTEDPALAVRADTVNLWQAVEIDRDGHDLRLAAGAIASRRGTMAYQPAVLADGTLVGVYALNTGLSPRAGALGIQSFPDRYGPPRRLAGALLDDADETGYGTPRGLLAPAAVSPAGLPDGRVAFAYDPGGRGDFGLYVVRRDGSGLEPIVDLPGTLELDPAPIVKRAKHPRSDATAASTAPPSADRFDYFCRNLFLTSGLDDPVDDAPPVAWPLTLRVFGVEPRPERASGDTVVPIREAPVRPDGSVLVRDLPAGVPLFEQVVDAGGAPLLTAHGAAHVAGYNFGRPGAVVRCVGCHTGHSTLAAGASIGDEALRWFDAAPGAEATSPSVAAGTAGARAAIDRKTRGRAESVAWISDRDHAAVLTLRWRAPLRVRRVTLHAVDAAGLDGAARTAVAIGAARLTFSLDGREGRVIERARGSTSSTVIETGDVVADALEIRLEPRAGSAAHGWGPGLAEVECLAALSPPPAAPARLAR